MSATLGFDDTRKLLAKYVFPLPKEGRARTVEGAVRIADDIGLPVILKMVSSDTSPNTSTVLNSAEEVGRKYPEILRNAAGDLEEVLVQEHVGRGMEVLVGMTRDPKLGPIITFSLSGVFAFLKDTAHRIAPLSRDAALELVTGIDAYDIIKGDGNKRPGDAGAVADIIEKVSRLSVENKDIIEIDVNTLLVDDGGAVVIDARMVVG